MSVASTCAPSRAKASAAARPLPCAAAVTKTRFPLRRIRERDESRYSVVRSSGWTSLAVTRAGEQFVAMIDAHQHFWELGRHDCTWPTPDLSAIYRDCIPAELEALARGAGVRGSVLVQSQESDRDTDYLCDVAQHTDFVLGVVGWVDLAAPGAPARIAQLARRPKLRGLRPMLQDQADDSML